MIFYNGHWEKKMGVNVYHPKEIYEYGVEESQLHILAPDTHIFHKGMTLDGLNFTFRITVPHKEVFRVQMFHYMGVKERGPCFSLKIQEENLSVQEQGEFLVLSSGRAQMKIGSKDFRFEFFFDGEKRTSIQSEDLCYIRKEDRGFLYEDFSGPVYMRCATGIGVGECIYGLGEHFGPLVKNGQSMDLRRR